MSQKRTIARDRRRVAVHEASHAVVARVLTLACDGATVRPDHDSAGHSITADPWACVHQWEKRGKLRGENAVWHARIMAFMAGAEGERLLAGVSTPAGDGDDRAQIDLMAAQLDVDALSWARLEARLRAMTRTLVNRHRDRIERVAEALSAQGSLAGAAIDHLAGRSVNDVKVNAPLLLAIANDQ